MLNFSTKPRIGRPRRYVGARVAPSPPRVASIEEPMESRPPDEQALLARGWHDSSVELKRGLEITEDLPMESLPPDLRPGFGSGRP